MEVEHSLARWVVNGEGEGGVADRQRAKKVTKAEGEKETKECQLRRQEEGRIGKRWEEG